MCVYTYIGIWYFVCKYIPIQPLICACIKPCMCVCMQSDMNLDKDLCSYTGILYMYKIYVKLYICGWACESLCVHVCSLCIRKATRFVYMWWCIPPFLVPCQALRNSCQDLASMWGVGGDMSLDRRCGSCSLAKAGSKNWDNQSPLAALEYSFPEWSLSGTVLLIWEVWKCLGSANWGCGWDGNVLATEAHHLATL